MQIAVDKLLFAEGAIRVQAPENFVHPLIFPARLIAVDVPLENTKSSATGGNAEAFFTLAQLRVGLLSRRDIKA